MQNFTDAVLFAINVTLPSTLLLGFGIFLRRAAQINEHFIAQASKLVYHYGLPCLLFANLAESNINYGEQALLLAAGTASVLVCFATAELYAWKFVADPRDKGVFVQGVFRANLGIMGLAFVFNAYGESGVAAGAVYTGLITILFNILAVITLSRAEGSAWHKKAGNILKKIFTNPLILAIVAALLLQHFHIPVPKPIMKTAGYVANISLPLALICAGAAFDIRSMLKMSDISLQASIGRLFAAPVIAVITGLAFGLSGVAFGVLFLMTATPVAAAAYVMAKAMGGNDTAAANITGITTFGAMFTATAGIVALRSLGLM